MSVNQISFQIILGPYCQNLQMKIVQEYEDYQNNLSARGGGGNELKTGGDG